MSFDPRELRDAFGCFATGVTVITTAPEGFPPFGMTANSFSSVSLDPPLVSWCMGKNSEKLTAFENSSSYTVNILSEDQQDLSNHFAKKDDHSLDSVPHSIGANGCAILDNVIAHIECDIEQRIDAGDHIIMLGRVTAISNVGGRPLLFSQGSYGAVK